MTTSIVRVSILALATLPAWAQSMFRGDAAHSGAYAGSGPRQFHAVKWKFATGDRVVSSPVFSDGVIYFGSDDHNVYAVDAATGRQIWKVSTLGPVASSPAVAGGIVYFTSYDGRFYAVDAKNGKLKWKFATGGERRYEAKGLHGMQPKTQTIADPWDVYLSSPGNFRRAMSCMLLRRLIRARSTSAVGTASSTRWMRQPERKNGA